MSSLDQLFSAVSFILAVLLDLNVIVFFVLCLVYGALRKKRIYEYTPFDYFRLFVLALPLTFVMIFVSGQPAEVSVFVFIGLIVLFPIWTVFEVVNLTMKLVKRSKNKS